MERVDPKFAGIQKEEVLKMAEEQTAPYLCHIFVCTNDRKGERKSCADGNSPALRVLLKNEIKNLGLQGRVRVSQSGCMGLCKKGPNVILYPQKIWFSDVGESDVHEILSKVESLLNE